MKELYKKWGFELALVYLVLITTLMGFYYIKPAVTGFIIAGRQFSYADGLELVFNESQEHIWSLENPGLLKSVRISGTIENKGNARIYIENKNRRYLIFDSDKLNQKEILDKITGFAAAEKDKEKGKEPNKPPMWSSNIEAFIVNRTLTLDLDDYFEDKDGDVLTYSASEIRTDDLGILLENSILTLNNKNNAGGNRILEITASDNTTSKKRNVNVLLIKDEGIAEGENETEEKIEIITKINKIINTRLDYKTGSGYDVDDNGIETTTGIIDFTVEDTKFNWDVDESKLCTQWETYSVDEEESTVACYGNRQCCSLAGLEPVREDWDETFYSYYGFHGATFKNRISSRVIYANYNISLEQPYAEVVYSNWKRRNAVYYESLIKFDNICLDTCTLFDIFNETSYKLIFEVNDTVLNLNAINYTIEKEAVIFNEAPVLIKNISNITIIKNKNFSIDLNEYFADFDGDLLEFDYYRGIENISVGIEDNVATIIPDKGFVGTKYMFFTANDSYASAVSNVFKVIVTDAKQLTALVEVGKEVKWVERLTVGNLSTKEDVKISLPVTAFNLSIKNIRKDSTEIINNEKIEIFEDNKIKNKNKFEKEKEVDKLKRKLSLLKEAKNKKAKLIIDKEIEHYEIDSEINGLENEKILLENELEESEESNLITANLIKEIFYIENRTNETVLIINDTSVLSENDEIEIEYWTEAPALIEEETAFGKGAKIISDTHYENVLAYASIKETKQGNIKLFKINENEKELVTENINYLDLNNNNLIDKIEWIVPSLSNATYEISITILNVQSFPTVGGNWTVRFTTTGIGNLTISASNGTTNSELNNDDSFTTDDLVPLKLTCDNYEHYDKNNLLESAQFFIILNNGSKIKFADTISQELKIKGIYTENYQCNGTGYWTVKVLTEGVHTQQFNFSGEIAYANNLATLESRNFTADAGRRHIRTTANDDKIIAYWSFDEGQEQSASDSVGGHDGILGNTTNAQSDDPTWTRNNHKGGYALEFDGTDDFVNGTDSSAFDIFNGTIEAWIFPKDLVKNRYALTREIDGSTYVLLGVPTDNKWQFVIKSGTTQEVTIPTSDITLNQYNHIAATFGQGGMDIYLNGILRNSSTTLTHNLSGFAGKDLIIGKSKFQTGTAGFWNGTIDEVRIYNKSLSSEDVYQHYKDRIGILLNWTLRTEPYEADNNTVLLMHLDGNFNDSSRYGHHGTAQNGVNFTTGRFGSPGILLDGVEDYVTVSDNNDFTFNDGFTAELWLKVNNLGNDVPLGQKADAGTSAGFFYTIGTAISKTLDFRMSDGSTGAAVVATFPLATDTWYHAAAVFRKNISVELYIDGVIQNSSPTNITGPINSDQNLGIGAKGNGAQFFDGIIDEVRISNVSRERDEFREYYTAGAYQENAQDAGEIGNWLNITWKENNLELESDNNTVLLLHFDENTGQTAFDSSGMGNDGTLGSSAGADTNDPAWIEGLHDYGLRFDGSSFVNAGEKLAFNVSTSTVTLEAWIKTFGRGVAQYIVSKNGGNRPAYQLIVDSTDEVEFQTFGAVLGQNLFATGTTLVTDGAWHHLVGYREGSNVYLYVDGVLENSSSGTAYDLDAPESLCIGSASIEDSTGCRIVSGFWFNGTIDEVRILNRSLTASEIKSNFKKGLTDIYLQTRTSRDNLTYTNWTGNADVPTFPETNKTLLYMGFDDYIAECYDNETKILTRVEVSCDLDNNINNNQNKKEKRGSQNWQTVTETVASPREIETGINEYINFSVQNKGNAEVPELADGAVSKTVASPRGVGVRTSTSEVPLLGALNTGNSLKSKENESCYNYEWKYFSELNGSEEVSTLNPETGKTEFQKPTAYQTFDHDGEMYRIETDKGDLLVSPKHKVYGKVLESNYLDFSSSLRSSSVLSTLTRDCFFNLGSFDQMPDLSFKANAKNGASLACGDTFSASDLNSLKNSDGLTLMKYSNVDNANSKSLFAFIPAYFIKSSLLSLSSDNAYFGVNSSSSKKSDNTIISLTGFSRKKEKSIFEFTTNLTYHPSSWCLFQTRSFNSSPSLSASSSVNLLCSKILSNAANMSFLLDSSSNSCLTASSTTLDHFISGCFSISPFTSSETLNFNSAILSSPTLKYENDFINVADFKLMQISDVYEELKDNKNKKEENGFRKSANEPKEITSPKPYGFEASDEEVSIPSVAHKPEGNSNFKLMPITDAYKAVKEGKKIIFLDEEGNEVEVLSIEKENYDGKIYDVDVENDIVLVKRNNSIAMWSGNSDNPKSLLDTRALTGYDKEKANLKHPYIDVNDENLVGYWRFEEIHDNQNVVDYSKYGNDGVLGTPTAGDSAEPVLAEGFVGNALEFDGVNDFVNFSNQAPFENLGKITIETWIKRARLKNHGQIVAKHDPNANERQFFLIVNSDDFLRFGYTNDGTTITQTPNSGKIISGGEWHHVVGTYDGSTLRTYVDGVENTNIAYSSGGRDGPATLMIGREVDGTFFNGTIDEVAIWNRSLSGQEISAHALGSEYNTRQVKVKQGKFHSGIYINNNATFTLPLGAGNDDDTLFLARFDDNVKGSVDEYAGEDGETGNFTVDYCNIPNIVGAWKFEKSPKDECGRNNGTVFGPLLNTSGYIGEAYRFNNSYVNVSNSNGALNFSATDSFSLELWVNAPLTVGAPRGIMQKSPGGAGNGAYRLESQGSNSINFQIEDDASNSLILTLNFPWANDNWHHLIAVRDVAADELRFYADGNLITSTTDTTTGGFKSPLNLIIGANGGGGERINATTIDEVAVYNRSLTENEIRGHAGAVYARDKGRFGGAFFIANETLLKYKTDQNIEKTGTIQFWLKPGWNGNDNIQHYLFDTAVSSTQNRISIYKTLNNDLIINLTGSSGSRAQTLAVDNTNIAQNNWHHLAFTYSATNATGIFINGDKQTTTYAESTTFSTISNFAEFMFIGTDFNQNFIANATFDDFKISSRELKEYEIYNEYLGNFNASSGTIQFYAANDWLGNDNSEHYFFRVPDKSNSTKSLFQLYKDTNNNLVFNLSDGAARANITYDISNWQRNNFTHVAVAWEQGGNIELYTDGVLRNNTGVSNVNFNHIINNLTSYMYVGSFNSSYGHLNGTIDDLSIWNYKLTSTEIKPQGYLRSKGENLTNANGRYIQWRAIFNSRDPEAAASLESVTITLNETTIQISNCSIGGCFIIQNASGSNIAVFDSFGNLDIKGTYTLNTVPSSDANDFIVQNSTGALVFVITNPEGNMEIRGNLNENQGELSAPLSSFVIQNSTAGTIAYVDNTGNLFLKKTLEDNVNFD